MTSLNVESEDLEQIVTAALHEDLGLAGDLTTDAVVFPSTQGVAHFVARQRMVVAGLVVAREVFHQLDHELEFVCHHQDGDRVASGASLATVRGDARPILRGERTALNFMMRMSGIATLTRRAVDEVEGTGARILDTRKTAPGLRQLDKYAVAAGGALNHRLGLHDAIMIKDTHLAVVSDLEESVRRARATGLPAEKITAEVRTLDELDVVIRAGAGRALLDNMSLETVRAAVRQGGGRIVLEASGGLRVGELRALAEAGVDFLSLGVLTHSAAAADIAMEMEAQQ